jgi:hypothetical protein
LLVGGCGANTEPSAPYAVSVGPLVSPTEKPAEQPTPEPEVRADPTIVAQGFTANAELDSASYGVVIANPNPTWVPRFVSVRITFLDADGTVLTTQTQNITGIRPDTETAVAGEVAEAGRATDMEVEISSLNVLPTPIRESLSEAGQYRFERVETSQRELGGIVTTGAVLSSFESEQANVPIHVVYYNAVKEVVGGAVTSIDHLPPGGDVGFEANTAITIPNIAETRVFGHVGFGT